ncbi:MAG TPA: YcnI family protein [Nocardioides sp.]|nr:YcnI family protein [Nocardioides sp.]
MNLRRITLPAATAAGALALAAAPASAHVTVSPDTTAAGAYAVLTFSVGHGCEGSPTTRLTIAMPEEIPSVTPTLNPMWDVRKVTERLDEPVTDSHGNEIVERVSQVVYTAKQPLPDGYRDTVALSVQLPDAEGESLAFPVVQTCQRGETGWTETATDGQDPEELEAPAPVVTITAADGGHAASATVEEDTGSEESAGTDNSLAAVGLGAGLAGLAVGVIALARTRRS